MGGCTGSYLPGEMIRNRHNCSKLYNWPGVWFEAQVSEQCI